MLHKICLLLIISFAYTNAFAQADSTSHAIDRGYNLDYRVNYDNKMMFKLDINTDLDNFYVPRLYHKTNSYVGFNPNEVLKLRFSFDYRFLGISYSYSPNFLPGNNDQSQKGNTHALDLSFKFFYSDRWRQEVTYKSIKGFYIDTQDLQNPYMVFDKLQIKTYGGKTFYIVNNNFSYRAFDTQTERQLKNAGSLIPSISYYFNNLQTNNEIDEKGFLHHINSFDVFCQIGYLQNIVLNKKWFTTIGFHPGFGVNLSKNYFYLPKSTKFDIKSSESFNFNWNANFALGYNNSNFFSGVKANYTDFNYLKQNSAEIINTKFTLEFFLGYRFNETKKIKKIFNYLENRFGL